MEYDNTNTGILTKNDKAGNEKRPDYRGFLNVAGVEHEIAGWIRKRKADGRPFLSLTVQLARPKPVSDPGATAAIPAATAQPAPQSDEEALPF